MANITKIYDIKLTGQKELVKNMQSVNKSFEDAKKRFTELKAQLGKGGFNAPELQALKLEYEKTRLEVLKLRKASQELTNEGKAQINATRIQREEEKKARAEKKLTLTEYQKLSKELTELRNHAKEVGVVFGEKSKEFREAAQEANVLDQRIKKIDASLGQFQRNVGNYPKTINIGSVNADVFKDLKNAGIDDVLGSQINRTRDKVSDLNREFNELQREIKQARTSGVGDLNALEQEIIQNRLEADRLNNEIRQSETHLNGLGGVGTGVFGRMGSDVKQLILGYVGLQAAMSAVSTTVRNMRELSDQTTNLEIELDKAAGGVDNLVNKLAQIDTRTKLVELEGIANIAVKAGVSESNLAGVTSAIDKIKIAFGKDFGDVEQGTESLVKLINIFEGEGNVTEQNLLQMGNAVRTLANESVASVPFLNDFSKRMAGLKGISDISLPSVLGLASGFEQFGQTAETSSTALVKIIPKLASDTKKFAEVAGLTEKQFKDLLNSRPEEALIRVSEGLVKGKQDIEGISKAFADSELGSGRIASVLGVIGKNGDAFRKSITSAGEAYKNTSNITEAFNKKNENFAATLDKIGKKFADLGNNKALINVISLTASTLLGLIQIILGIPFPVWIGAMALLTLAYWKNIAATHTLIATKVSLAAQEAILNALIVYKTILTNAQTAATWLLNGAKRALLVTMRLFPGITAAMRAAWLLLNTTFLATPLGWLLAGILAIGAATVAAARSVDNHTKAVDKNIQAYREKLAQQRLNIEIDRKAVESYKEQIAKLKALTQVAINEANSKKTRLQAVKELIKIDARYQSALKGDIILTGKLKDITKKLTDEIKENARARARANLLTEKEQRIIEIEFKNEELRSEIKKRKGLKGNYTDKELIKKTVGELDAFTVGEFGRRIGGLGGGNGAITDQLKENLKLLEELKADSDRLAKQVVASDIQNDVPKTGNGDGDDPKIEDFKESKPVAEKRDYLKELEAKRDKELAINEEVFTKGEESEREYLIKIRDINIDFLDKKIAYLKGKNAEELKEKAQASLEKVKIEKETNAKLFELEKQNVENLLEEAKDNAQKLLDAVIDDPNTNTVQKGEAEQRYYEDLLIAQTNFNEQMSLLEKEYVQNSIQNEEQRKDEIIEIQTSLNKTLTKLIADRFKQNNDIINRSVDSQENKLKLDAELKKQEVLNDKTLSTKQKEIELDKIIAQNQIDITQAEIARVDALIRSYELKRATNGLNEDEKDQLEELILKYAELNTTLLEKEEEIQNAGKSQLLTPSDNTTQDVIKQNLIKSFGLDESEVGNLLGNVIAGSYDLANQAMNGYFDAERSRIEQSKQLAYDRIDLERQQLLNAAQSAAERDSIERQSAEKKKQADKEAGQKLKKVKKTELQIALAMELANIAVAAASNPLNGVTFGGAGIAMYSVLAGLALAKYAVNLANINKAQFGRGGELTGPSHSENNGMPVINPNTGEVQAYVEGGEGIVNKRAMSDNSTYSVTGTPSQIASKINAIGGGVEWSGGASLTKYLNGGSYLGAKVQPPVFRSYYESRGASGQVQSQDTERLDRIEEMILNTNAVLNKEVHRKTIISSREMSDVQRENYKQSEIATL